MEQMLIFGENVGRLFVGIHMDTGDIHGHMTFFKFCIGI